MSDADRPRDPQGRPRNDRPRDALGRPLATGSAGATQVPDDLDLTDAQTVAYARELLDAGRAFAAHEVFEAAWKHAPDEPSRQLWRGLAQLMVAVTHAQRGNAVGAQRLLLRGEATLDGLAPVSGVDVADWVDVARTHVG
jgi:uncharacterized protein